MAIITIDCDEVLADTNKALLAYYDNTFCGVPLTWEEVSNYHFEHLQKMVDGGVTRDMAKDTFDHFIATHSLEQTPALTGMYEMLSDLKQRGHRLYVLTARPETVKDATVQWLDKHFPALFHDVIFTNHFTDAQTCKGDVCQSLGSACMIDDNLIHAEKIAAYNIPTIMPARPWNAHYNNDHEYIIKVDSDGGMREALQKRGFL